MTAWKGEALRPRSELGAPRALGRPQGGPSTSPTCRPHSEPQGERTQGSTFLSHVVPAEEPMDAAFTLQPGLVSWLQKQSLAGAHCHSWRPAGTQYISNAFFSLPKRSQT